MKKRDSRAKLRIILFLLCFVAFAAVAFAAVMILGKTTGNNGDTPTETTQAVQTTAGEDWVEFRGVSYRPRKNIETILIMGIDKFSPEVNTESFMNNQQNDFLQLIVLDRKSGQCDTLMLNRDTMTYIPQLDFAGREIGGHTAQLALAHTYGSGGVDSCLNTVKAVERFFGSMVEIDHYIALTMDAVRIVNDAVGGVTVTIEDDFSAVTDELPLGETVTLMGDNALTFVRSRHYVGDSTNVNRMHRQQVYLESLFAKLKETSAQNEGFLLKTILELSDYMTSDCSANKLSELYDKCMTAEMTVHESIGGEAVKGKEFMEFYADEESLVETIIALFFEPVS